MWVLTKKIRWRCSIMLFTRNKRTSIINRNFIMTSVILFLICIMLLLILYNLFKGYIPKKITFSEYISVVFSMSAVFISLFSWMCSLEGFELTQISLQPYLNITSKLDGNVLLICLENVGKGELYNLRLNQSTNSFLNNYGRLESETLVFDSINMYVNKKEKYIFFMKDDCSFPLNNLFKLVFFFNDASGNPYKQTISVIYNKYGFLFMPQAVEHRKKRDI